MLQGWSSAACILTSLLGTNGVCSSLRTAALKAKGFLVQKEVSGFSCRWCGASGGRMAHEIMVSASEGFNSCTHSPRNLGDAIKSSGCIFHSPVRPSGKNAITAVMPPHISQQHTIWQSAFLLFSHEIHTPTLWIGDLLYWEDLTGEALEA